MLPDAVSTLVGREDGGNLIIMPPRDVWERSELMPDELMSWSFLIAATGRAMIEALPQLQDGCINYWEAGNWALNDAAEPPGRKTPRKHRHVHLHLLGRSPRATSPNWRWGEAPNFPDYADRLGVANAPLRADECSRVVAEAQGLLKNRYGMKENHILPWAECTSCGHPSLTSEGRPDGRCAECSA